MPRGRRRGLRNYDPAELESAPRSHAHATNFQCGANASAQFLLNLCLCALRLHIQIYPEQERRAERNRRAKKNERNPEQLLHLVDVTQREFEEKTKAYMSFRAERGISDQFWTDAK